MLSRADDAETSASRRRCRASQRLSDTTAAAERRADAELMSAPSDTSAAADDDIRLLPPRADAPTRADAAYTSCRIVISLFIIMKEPRRHAADAPPL